MICNSQTARGIIAIESYDYEIVDYVSKPFKNFTIVAEIHSDGAVNKTLIGSIADPLKADKKFLQDWEIINEYLSNSSLEIVTFTVTEKAYKVTDIVRKNALLGPDNSGTFLN